MAHAAKVPRAQSKAFPKVEKQRKLISQGNRFKKSLKWPKYRARAQSKAYIKVKRKRKLKDIPSALVLKGYAVFGKGVIKARLRVRSGPVKYPIGVQSF